MRKSMTSTVYVINNNRVLLHNHKKYNSLFPVGGHIEEGELPQDAATREVREEAGLEVELYNRDSEFDLGRVVQLHNPMYTLLENVGYEVENIDFIYFARALSNELKPQTGESKELYWFTKEEIDNNKDIKPHVKVMALDALRILSN